MAIVSLWFQYFYSMKKVLCLGSTFYISVIMKITFNNHNLFGDNSIQSNLSTS
jgi:hypothetical protein